jgi:LytR cell envelope-related transcriptional attenuator
VGLVALSMLHVSQARDLQWLRERAGRGRRPAPRYRRPGLRSVAAGFVALLVLAGALTRLTAGDSGPVRAKQEDKPKRAAVKPGKVTVAVLNGTTVPGLAAAIREQIAASGFKKGMIDTFPDQQLTASVVQYSPGHAADARAVGRRLGISRRAPVSAESRARAGAATVIVIAGADKAP